LMRLETITLMDRAISLYGAAGFRRCPPYYTIPDSFRAITIFMEKDLTVDSGPESCGGTR
jgi:hypothetical protein